MPKTSARRKFFVFFAINTQVFGLLQAGDERSGSDYMDTFLGKFEIALFK
jgi:hypothetical protein